MTLSYDGFLNGAAALLVSSGARPLLQEFASGNEPAWTKGWDQILIGSGPGPVTIYAFGAAHDPHTFQERLDRLARGVATIATTARGNLTLAAVAVFPPGVDSTIRKKVARSAPTTYFQGLRPVTWTVDLGSGQIHTGRFGNSEANELLSLAIRNATEGEVLDAHGVSERRQVSVRREQAFYQLMQGRQPYTTYGLIAINSALYLLLYTRGGPTDSSLRDFGALSPILIQHGEWWRLFTSMFLHAGVAHILFNMTSLFAVGTLAERLYGSMRFLAIYLGAGLIGSATSFTYAVVTNNTNVLGVGASGAIFGVAGALITVRFQRSEVIPQSLRNRISGSILPLVALSLVIAFLTPQVDNAAHVGGLVGGMALSFLFPLIRHAPSERVGQ